MQQNPAVPISTLVVRCAHAAPDADDWSRLVERLTPPLRGTVAFVLQLRSGRSRSDLVDDLVQEVWCRLLAGDRRALRDFRGGSEHEATAYLRRIATGIVLDRLRRDAADKRPPEGAAVDAGDEAAGLRLADRRGCPERRLLAREEARRLAALCAELVGKSRRAERLEIARLALVEGWSSRQIASRLGLPWNAANVNSLLFRLRRRLAARGVRLPARVREVAA